MRNRPNQKELSFADTLLQRSDFNRRLARYLVATGSVAGPLVAGKAHAVIVTNTTVQPFGINGEVNIDLNQDGQIDFQIDHDRVNLNGTDLDYLQIDKNDVSSAAMPLPVDPVAVFPPGAGQAENADHAYIAVPDDALSYPVALTAGTEVGPNSTGWLFQETNNYLGQGIYLRANRLIDEDATQIDSNTGFTVQQPSTTPGWLGLSGEVRYLGVQIDIYNEGNPDNNFLYVDNGPANFWYGWIGVRITNEADATGEVVGYAYESEKGVAIMAGDVGSPAGVPGDYNGNDMVDAADYVVWRDAQTAGATTLDNRDPSQIGNPVGEADYNFWRANFGNPIVGSGSSMGLSSAVPEPSSLVVAVTAGVAIVGSFLFRRLRD